jgi:hypothetical protein
MTKRLVYLPDPTIKFYVEFEEDGILDLYNNFDIDRYQVEKAPILGELVVDNKAQLFKLLKERFNSTLYDKPYFSNLSNIISHFDVLDIKDT